MLKNHDLGVILAPMIILIPILQKFQNIVFQILFFKKILFFKFQKMSFGHHRCQDKLIISKICVQNLFKILRVKMPMSRFGYI